MTTSTLLVVSDVFLKAITEQPEEVKVVGEPGEALHAVLVGPDETDGRPVHDLIQPHLRATAGVASLPAVDRVAGRQCLIVAARSEATQPISAMLRSTLPSLSDAIMTTDWSSRPYMIWAKPSPSLDEASREVSVKPAAVRVRS